MGGEFLAKEKERRSWGRGFPDPEEKISKTLRKRVWEWF